MNWKKILDYRKHIVTHIFSEDFKVTTFYIKNHKIFSTNNNLVKNADIETFEILQTYNSIPCFARDKNYLYYFWNRMKNIDRDTFEYIGDNYYKDCNNVYAEYETSLRPLKGSDIQSFKYLGNGYAFDNNYGYYRGTYIRSCQNPTTLKINQISLTILDSCSSSFAKDEVNVYYQTKKIKNCDRDSWVLVDNCFSKDKNFIYYNEDKLPYADVNSWECLRNQTGENYSKDDKSVFIGYKKLPNVNVQSWKYLGNGYSKDNTQVYHYDEVLEGENPNNWTKVY